MSKVIPNHVVRVGQTISVPSREKHVCMQPNGCLPCHTLPTQCMYYSMEDWDRQNSLTQSKGCSRPKMELYDSCKPLTEVTPIACLQEEAIESSKDICPTVSPTLDVSIEKLNRLILEIDPTFQPLQLKPVQTQNPDQDIPQSDTVVAQKPEGTEILDYIKYIEMTPARANYQEPWQSSASASSTPLSMSPPNQSHWFPHGGIHEDRCGLSGPGIFMSSRDSRGPPQHLTGRQSPACIQVSESISIPQKNHNGSTTCGSSLHLASSPGSENLLKSLQLGRKPQRSSAASMLSTSPGSDTSYILGSSNQSLSNIEGGASHTRSTGSPSSIGSLNSSYVGSYNSGSYCPNVTCSQKGNSSLPQPIQNAQTQSLSPASTPPTVPIVLINGCLEDTGISHKVSKIHQGSFKQKASSSNPGVFSGASKTSSDSCFKETQPSMKFVMDTSKFWFKPSITRDQAVQLLVEEPPGTFIMRDSTSYRGSFGLAMKAFDNSTGEAGGNHIRHFLIESSARGVHLKGADDEPYFGSLSAFVYQHMIMPLALPCKLVIPSQEGVGSPSHSRIAFLVFCTVCNLLYLHSVTMETLTGAAAVRKAVSSTFELETLPTPTVVHFKVTEQGITLTDVQRKVFFRRHYPLTTISFCDMDPENRKWQKFSKTSRIFGVVSKSPADSENVCHLFAEYDAVHPASHIVNFIRKLLPAEKDISE
uniref:Tensin 4 n=1 Tax=Salvator merianae TaxID=96440 RepID=A0A8D0DLJ3_SALMN